MSRFTLDYVPSWLDGSTTLLQRLNKCIEKIEELSLRKLNAEELTNVLKGSETIVVDIAENNTDVEVHLDAGVVADIERSIKTPLSTPQEDSVPVLKPNGEINFVPKYQVGTKHYLHEITEYNAEDQEVRKIRLITNKQTIVGYTVSPLYERPDDMIIFACYVNVGGGFFFNQAVINIQQSYFTIDGYIAGTSINSSFVQKARYTDEVTEI